MGESGVICSTGDNNSSFGVGRLGMTLIVRRNDGSRQFAKDAQEYKSYRT